MGNEKPFFIVIDAGKGTRKANKSLFPNLGIVVLSIHYKLHYTFMLRVSTTILGKCIEMNYTLEEFHFAWDAMAGKCELQESNWDLDVYAKQFKMG